MRQLSTHVKVGEQGKVKRAVKFDRESKTVLHSSLPMFKALPHPNTFHSAKVGLSLAVALVFLAMAPLAVALGVHHELAAADHDGHQHSDFDLCQWVQQHASSSFSLQPVVVAKPRAHCRRATELSSHFIDDGPSVSLASPRGPPLS